MREVREELQGAMPGSAVEQVLMQYRGSNQVVFVAKIGGKIVKAEVGSTATTAEILDAIVKAYTEPA